MPVRPTRVRRLRTRKAAGRVAFVGAALFVVAGYAAVQKTITLVIEGRPEPVRTMSANVGQLLESEGIVLGERAVVVPPQQTPLADGMTVLVDRLYFPPVTTGSTGMMAAPGSAPEGVGAWVLEGVDGSAAMLAARTTENWFSAGGPAGRPAAVAASVVVMGKDHDVLTNATSVGELLSAMGIDPDRDDRVLPAPKAPLHDGTSVRYVSIEHRIRAIEVPIPYTSQTVYTDELKPGRSRVTQTGADGLMVERYRMKIVNGETVSRSLLGRRVVRAAQPERRLVGRQPAQESANSAHGHQVGEASWYSFAPGSGLTAAHPWLPFGTVVDVTNLGNGKSVRVVINDRGPFGGRIIDLSDQAFAQIAPLSQGVARVRLTW